MVTNAYRAVLRLPKDLRRVAVLPIAVDERSPDAVAGQLSLQPVLNEELLHTHKFEVIPVAIDDMIRWFGKPTFSAEERLPADLLKRLESETKCDAVFFSRLTAFRPYPPVALGWDLRLVWGPNAEILWSVDDFFDAGETPVAAAARKQFKTQENVTAELADPGAGLQSPRRVAQYSLRAALETLQPR
jgi:hypothetical protein